LVLVRSIFNEELMRVSRGFRGSSVRFTPPNPLATP
jgi:hypothetical protein